jgi:single-strand DNA-binding protein
VAEVGIAVNRKYTVEGEKREEVVFLEFSYFGKTAENIAEYLKKGSKAFFVGRLGLDQWEDKQTGQKRSKIKIIGEEIEFLGSRQSSDEDRSQRPASGSRQDQRRPSGPPKPPRDPDLDTEEDDIPF